ncbi:MAG: hypothetical protein QOH84_299 [Kribbellaceae bacterium]|jgi:hypothetical protein|nr:hypothetical protein [Kribbellaceae bacterium]
MKSVLRALLAVATAGIIAVGAGLPSAQANQGTIFGNSELPIGSNRLYVHSGANWYWSTCSASLAECSQLAKSEGIAYTVNGAKPAQYSMKLTNSFTALGIPQQWSISPGVSFVKSGKSCYTDTYTGSGTPGRFALTFSGTNCSYKVWASDICKATITATGGARYGSTWYLKDSSASRSFCS